MRQQSLLAPILLLSLASASPAAVVSSFDSDLDGWRISGDNNSAWSPTGGNPDGCIFVNDLATGARNDAVAPPKFLGDWSAATSADTIRCDVYTDLLSGGFLTIEYAFRISGPGGTAIAAPGFLPPEAVWTTVSVPLDPSSWVIESGTWSEILEQVTTLLVVAEFVDGNEDTRIDNVELSLDPVTVFEPCAVEVFDEGGGLDWTFSSTGGVSFPTTGGNTGGFLRVNDGTGISIAFAPSRFLGDWSSLDGTGTVTIDLRLLSRAAAPDDVAEFIRLSGPGGVASVPLAGADIPESGLVWKTFAFPIDDSTWSVTEGTWAGLLANVTECRIRVEYVNGSEQVGVDNFGRLAADCPEIDPGIVIEHPDFMACGYESFAGIDAIARNPNDGEIYGLVDAGTSSGGGLYPVTGPGAALRLQSFTSPADLLFTSDGTVFISEDGAGRIYRWDPVNGAVLWVTGFHSGDDDPGAMAFAPVGFDGPDVTAGDVIVSDFGFNGPDEFWSFSPTVAEGERQIVPDLPGDPDFREIAADPAGKVYAADALDPNSVYRLLPDGTLLSFALSTPVEGMVDIDFSVSEQVLYALSASSGTLHRIDPITGAVELIASGFDGLNNGTLEVHPATAELFVADGAGSRVYRICPDGTIPVEPQSVVSGGGVIRSLMAWPNPASAAATQVAFDAREDVALDVEIYDLAGRLVRRIGRLPGWVGPRAATWDHRDTAGNVVANGMYIVRVRAGEETRNVRVTVLR